MEYRIQLTRGQWAIVDHDDYEALARFRWQARLNAHTRSFYARRYFGPAANRIVSYMAREILNVSDPLLRVDHINHDTLDNRKCNLRIATEAQNQHNQRLHRNSSTGLKGVTFDPRTGNYRAHITTANVRTSLGAYSTPERAYQARKEAEKRFHGDFAFNG